MGSVCESLSSSGNPALLVCYRWQLVKRAQIEALQHSQSCPRRIVLPSLIALALVLIVPCRQLLLADSPWSKAADSLHAGSS